MDDQREQRTRTLVADASRGEPAAVGELLADYLPRLRAFVRVNLSPALRARESCSDLVQSVCREVLADLDDFEYRGEARFRSWLFGAALNKIRSRYRYHHRAKRDIEREAEAIDGPEGDALLAQYATVATPSRDLRVHEEIARIESALDLLPAHYREVIALARVAGLPHEEVARRMDRTVGSVRQLLGRALVQLADRLDGS